MTDHPTTLAVLGSTGSVGRQALDVARAHSIPVDLLAAHGSVDAMEADARALCPRVCVLADASAARTLAIRLADTPVRVLGGEEALLSAIAESPATVFVNAVLGSAGLLPSLAVLEKGARLALANKESLVVAGDILLDTARRTGAEILPVDSEHGAIHQCLSFGKRSAVKRLILTASGGPFRGYRREQLASVTKREALAHPTWKMGEKITVDSATMMNKGFEIIEAARLFGMSADRVDVLVHPESIIHSMVEYIDNTVAAQLSLPDMCACVQYAITYPERREAVIPPLDLAALGSLTFHRPDPEAFPALALARAAVERGGTAPSVLNAADEVAVAAFLREEIPFPAIVDTVSEVVARIASPAATLPDILAADAEARRITAALISALRKDTL